MNKSTKRKVIDYEFYTNYDKRVYGQPYYEVFNTKVTRNHVRKILYKTGNYQLARDIFNQNGHFISGRYEIHAHPIYA